MPPRENGPRLPRRAVQWVLLRGSPVWLLLIAVVLSNDRGPGLTWQERLGLEMDWVVLAQQRMARACDEWSAGNDSGAAPSLLALHREIARRHRTPIDATRRRGLGYFHRDFRAFWIRGIAVARQDLVENVEGTDRADAPRCAAHRARLRRRLESRWLAIRADALRRMP